MVSAIILMCMTLGGYVTIPCMDVTETFIFSASSAYVMSCSLRTRLPTYQAGVGLSDFLSRTRILDVLGLIA